MHHDSRPDAMRLPIQIAEAECHEEEGDDVDSARPMHKHEKIVELKSTGSCESNVVLESAGGATSTAAAAVGSASIGASTAGNGA